MKVCQIRNFEPFFVKCTNLLTKIAKLKKKKTLMVLVHYLLHQVWLKKISVWTAKRKVLRLGPHVAHGQKVPHKRKVLELGQQVAHDQKVLHLLLLGNIDAAQQVLGNVNKGT